MKTSARPRPKNAPARRQRAVRPWMVIAVLALLAVGAVSVWALGRGPSPPGTAAGASDGVVVQATGVVVQATGGTWTNITPDRLAAMLQQKDFTLLNVKTPYVGEISGTDLYIPYPDLVARATDLPADKASKIVVYCRSGAESAIAAQALVALGYTNVDNLAGGMNAWTASGRQIVQVQR